MKHYMLIKLLKKLQLLHKKMTKDLTTCDKCKAMCCRTVTVEIDKPTRPEDWEDIRWQVAHKNVSVYLDNTNDWVIEFKTNCEHLDDKWRCKIYNDRPKMCREHELEECEINGEGNIAQVMLNSIEDVDKYLQEKKLKKKLGRKK